MSAEPDVQDVAPVQTEDAGRTQGLERVHVGEPLHWELVEFLEEEASRLDDNSLLEWLSFLAPDIRYRMPVRTTRERIDGSEFSKGMYQFDEDFNNLQVKVMRLAATQTAWAEKPPSRTRRFITNIRVYTLPDTGDEYEVRSNMLVLRSRYDNPNLELISGRRTDRVRRTPEGFRLAERTIYSDQATLGTQNLAIFL
jgi:3-phenylpropionate/cinnamic acid dioxygenase small subunit